MIHNDIINDSILKSVITPGLHNNIPALKILAWGWVAKELEIINDIII